MKLSPKKSIKGAPQTRTILFIIGDILLIAFSVWLAIFIGLLTAC